MPAGRPSEYTPEIAADICERLADGDSLRQICRDLGIGVPTVFRWLEASEEFRNQYARARDVQADVFADEISRIADDGSNDWMERNAKDNPGWVANGEHLQRSRLRVDTRKWIASKLKPKRYGERLELAGDDKAPLIVKVVRYTDGSSFTGVAPKITLGRNETAEVASRVEQKKPASKA